MKKVLLFGGTFDPIHLGHLEIAEYAYHTLDVTEVWFILAKRPRWKRGVSRVQDRLNMLTLALIDSTYFKISTIEVEDRQSKVNFTIDTIRKLKIQYPDIEFSYLIGYDQLTKLHKWNQISELSSLVHFVCVGRPGYNLERHNMEQFHVTLLDYSGPNIASSQIRNVFMRDFLPQRVVKYIEEHQLYLESRVKNYMSEHRFQHTLSVARVAKKIAINNHFSPQKAYKAALFHDLGKEYDMKETESIMNQYYSEYLDCPKPCHHQYISAYIAKQDFYEKDEEILTAIIKHCSSDTEESSMSTLDKILYVSDKIEPKRGYDSKDMIKACVENIDRGYEMVLNENLAYLKDRGIINRNRKKENV